MIVVDMMTMQDNLVTCGPLGEAALKFLESVHRNNPGVSVFALFDRYETGDYGIKDVDEMGYARANYHSSSMEWISKLRLFIRKHS